jgi:manganese oxidase
MTTPPPRRQNPWGTFTAATAVAALFFGIIAVYVAASDTPVTTATAGAAEPVRVTLREMAVEPASLEVPAGPVVLEVVNDGSATHDLQVEELGVATPMLNAGERDTLDLGVLEPGTYTLFCSVAGHRPAGMEATLTVTAADTVTEAAAGAQVSAGERGAHRGHAGHEEMSWQEQDRLMTESLEAFPAETEGRGAQLLEPTVLPDGTKEFELTAEIVDWEVEPGRTVEAWTYNGVVPGPTIKLEVGDRVRMVVHNELPVSTDVHWHGVDVPFEADGVAPLTQPFIEPGDTFVYEYTTTRPAVGMYHPHHHGFEKLPNGMLGTIIIGELPLPEGVEVSQEIPMVLNDAGTLGFGLNGKSFPATEPIVAAEGEWVLVHYLNEGLMPHPMHLHKLDQLVIAKDGFPLEAPYLADTINVAPGERYSVLVQASEVGTWAWHCHILTHAERDDGMFGMVTAMVVQ